MGSETDVRTTSPARRMLAETTSSLATPSTVSNISIARFNGSIVVETSIRASDPS